MKFSLRFISPVRNYPPCLHANVTIPAAALAVVMQLAGKEMERIAVCAEDGGGSAADTLKEENDVMLSLRAALDA